MKIKLLKLKWWERVILWFKPATVGIDYGTGADKSYYVIVKRLRDKYVVVREGEL